MDGAEVVVIGGGVIGAAIAFHLAEAGVTDVVVLEANALASGSSGKPLGGVRGQFSTPGNVRLGARSLQAFAEFGSRFGTDIGLRRTGYLFLLRTEADLAAFAAGVPMQNELGVPSRMLTPAEAAALNPYLDVTGVLGAAYSPADGYARPADVVHSYAKSARDLGVRFVVGTRATGVRTTASGAVRAVDTSAGPIRTGAVVCAAGAWSAQVGAMVGVDLPVEPVRRRIAFTERLTPTRTEIPFTIDFDSTFYFHPAGPDGRLLFGWAEPDQPAGFETGYDESWLPQLRSVAARCVPELAGVRFEGGWAGLYEMTPDRNALIGESPQVSRFLYATGFSGHGFLQAPAVGETVRDLYLGTPTVDLTEFDALRFVEAVSPAETAEGERNIV